MSFYWILLLSFYFKFNLYLNFIYLFIFNFNKLIISLQIASIFYNKYISNILLYHINCITKSEIIISKSLRNSLT